jgi:DNA-binding NarL/FixJ family response regulator
MVVDDDPMVITGIRGILQAADGIDVVASALSGEESIEKASLHYPDVVLMDIRMPGIGGIEATQRLLNSVRPPKVVSLTSMSSDDYLFRALEAGAAGYLLKDIGPVDLAAAVRKVHAGEPILAPQSMRQVIAKVRSNSDHRLQREAVELLAGLTRPRAADRRTRGRRPVESGDRRGDVHESGNGQDSPQPDQRQTGHEQSRAHRHDGRQSSEELTPPPACRPPAGSARPIQRCAIRHVPALCSSSFATWACAFHDRA